MQELTQPELGKMQDQQDYFGENALPIDVISEIMNRL
jgi:hypothetical protein